MARRFFILQNSATYTAEFCAYRRLQLLCPKYEGKNLVAVAEVAFVERRASVARAADFAAPVSRIIMVNVGQ